MGMTSIAPKIWNEIAETEPLATAWGKTAFAMGPDEIVESENKDFRAMKDAGIPPQVICAFMDMRPLLLERRAIARFVSSRPSLTEALPNVESVTEAVTMASKDHLLSRKDQTQLGKLLTEEMQQSRSSPGSARQTPSP